MRHIKAGFCFLILLGLLSALNTKFGSVPPLGKFFDPESGFWANAEVASPADLEMELPGLKDEVQVFYDERRVPHIFAANNHDLYYAMGYVVAKDRLFQMELQTYDAAGRLSEFLGERTLNRDLTTRRWGMGYAAERDMEFVKEGDPEFFKILESYTDGVNAFIESLDESQYPVEYKILDFEPEAWEVIKIFQLVQNLTRTLGAGNQDVRTSNTLRYFGEDFVDRFFTQDPELLEAIIPDSREWDFEAQVPAAPESLFVPSVSRVLEPFPVPEGVGSNNWAVSGSKTKSGYPILANDPHLSLTLPSIWYELQLNAPGINVYGVNFPGAPGIPIGFNEHIAWGETNTGSDLLDWYEIRFRDETKQEYWHDGQWKKTSLRVEEIKVRGQETVLDTVIYTHHGPVSEVSLGGEGNGSVYHAIKWIAHEPSNELKTFHLLNLAKDYDDYVEALTHFTGAAQNFVFASREGDIALWVNGAFPNKWKHQGRTVSDGTDPRYDWQEWIPRERNPHIKNPERAFVSSANQEPAASNYPYYLDDDFAPFERGKRINDRLREMEDITVQDMQLLQMDTFSYHAATILPNMINWVNQAVLTEEESKVLTLLGDWNFHNEADQPAPGIFRTWWSNFYYSIFRDEYDTTDELLRWPPRDRVTEVLKSDPAFTFVDDITTPAREDINDLATNSFKETIAALKDAYGPISEKWNWGHLIDNDINHIGLVPGMGNENIYTSGAPESINANRGGYGPSWRMVIELGPEVKGYGVYPGGNSGNPGSPNYDSMVDSWNTGQLFELNFMREVPSSFSYRYVFRAKE